MTPIILLCGESGTGKDTVAGFLAKNHKAQPIAFADPFKRFALNVFGFSEEQLWGPSEARNRVDARFADHNFCNTIIYKIKEATPKSSVYQDLMVDSELRHRSLQSCAFRLLKEAQEQGGLSARKMLQLIGSEWGRHLDKEMWVTRATRTSNHLLCYGGDYSRSKGYTPSNTPAPEFVCISDGRFRNEILNFREIGAQVWKIRSSGNASTATAGVANHASEVEQKSIPDFYYTHILDNDKSSGLGALEQTVKQAMDDLTGRTLKPEWLSNKLTSLRGW